jgi:hypothetical protein
MRLAKKFMTVTISIFSIYDPVVTDQPGEYWRPFLAFSACAVSARPEVRQPFNV